ncbi:hypothetical protein DCS_03263 [Drechmeria coniospora]|uniref:Mtf2-like C-terminal domain-containing protein n=1 Tax=Drechmeria coniospora TaxID=98403 RepID=A0A151GYE4_DRECN|nr:hypothetical protein DCS_03263 [Drechmeria coniospora]KYK62116.1 hypothetical protein DCS_03263 [Drechmeria coniospora]ODA81347.1 hypothetical protein RJ55_04312 [Drechmeria coniospora]
MSTLLPFLYRTRTLRQALVANALPGLVRHVHAGSRKRDNSIPFEWDPDFPQDELLEQQSTITPSEAEVFKGIFDEIAQGHMPAVKKRPSAGASTQPASTNSTPSPTPTPTGMARSIVEQARITEFREKFLRKYPKSLRNAAQVALGLYELEPVGAAGRQMLQLDEADEEKWRERARYDRIRAEERERVDALMNGCHTDLALWQVMERDVFSLPEKLGIAPSAVPPPKGKGSKRGKAKATVQATVQATADAPACQPRADETHIMDVHGPLYPHFLSAGLALFDTAFARSSPFAFQILPRVKALGLPSYVLGVSAPFYIRLARMYWSQFGDAASAIDVLREMKSAGLYTDEANDLLATIRDDVHACTWGAQGQFVMAMMEAPPYDGPLTQRLDDLERDARRALFETAA